MSINKFLKKENKKWGIRLARVPLDQWPQNAPETLIEVWRSRSFLVQIYKDDSLERLSVCKTLVQDGRWKENITWDELQKLKTECGRGGLSAVEIYPPNDQVVNVANMRHLWILKEPPEFMWRKNSES